MSKFKKGDRVRVVSITDIDADHDDPNRVMTTNEQVIAAGFESECGPMIGDTGTVADTYGDDYYTVSLELDKTDSEASEYWSMIDADLELITP